jgi:hypothetical protein
MPRRVLDGCVETVECGSLCFHRVGSRMPVEHVAGDVTLGRHD